MLLFGVNSASVRAASIPGGTIHVTALPVFPNRNKKQTREVKGVSAKIHFQKDM